MIEGKLTETQDSEIKTSLPTIRHEILDKAGKKKREENVFEEIMAEHFPK